VKFEDEDEDEHEGEKAVGLGESNRVKPGQTGSNQLTLLA
jgi:hypothetical protein